MLPLRDLNPNGPLLLLVLGGFRRPPDIPERAAWS
jgi:hypothetical protein